MMVEGLATVVADLSDDLQSMVWHLPAWLVEVADGAQTFAGRRAIAT